MEIDSLVRTIVRVPADATTSAISRLEIDLRGPQLRARAYYNYTAISAISRMEIDSRTAAT
jgi:hypothetical protein